MQTCRNIEFFKNHKNVRVKKLTKQVRITFKRMEFKKFKNNIIAKEKVSLQKQSTKISQALVDHIKLLTPKVNLTRKPFDIVQKIINRKTELK